MVRRLSTITTGFVLALALAGTAFASNEAVIGGTPSVKAVHSHGNIVVTFRGKQGRRLYRRIAGHKINVDCRTVQTDPTLLFESFGRVEDSFVPMHGGKLRTGVGGDWCEIIRVGKHKKLTPIVAVGVTPIGETFLDERLWAVVVDAVITSASFEAKGGHYPTADRVLAKLGPHGVVLASPSDTPQPGKFGFYSDGAQHIAAAAVAKSGKRLFEELNGDTVSSNTGAYMSSFEFDSLT
jgi:hypothetical protein